MNTIATWSWKDGKPPGPQTARAGETWTFCLPLVGTGPAPTIHWLELPPGLSVAPASADGLTFAFVIPADLCGIHRLRFQRDGAAHHEELLLKILPAESVPQTAGAVPEASTFAEVSSGLSIVGTRIDPQSEPVSSRLPTPDDIKARHAEPPAPSVPAETSVPSSPSLDPHQEYEIQVYRNGTLLSQLSHTLSPHNSLLVGKFSASKAVFPDIDLRQHFADSQAAALCSRQQARIYWSHDRILLHNIGKSPIRLPDGRLLSTDQTHTWMLGEEVGLPGGLSLRLAALGY